MDDSPASRGYVSTPEGQLHYRKAGKEGPWVVLLHETPLSSALCESAVVEFGRWGRAVAWDTPGYGMSDPPTRSTGIDGYAALIGAAMRTLNEGEPFVVCGAHTGASIAVALGRQFTEVCSAVLVGLPIYTPQQLSDRLRNWAPPRRPDETGAHLTWAWERIAGLWTDASPELRHLAVTELLSVLPRYEWGYEAAFSYPALRELHELTCPTLLVAAEGEFLAAANRDAAQQVGCGYRQLDGIRGQVLSRHARLISDLVQDFVNHQPARGTGDFSDGKT